MVWPSQQTERGGGEDDDKGLFGGLGFNRFVPVSLSFENLQIETRVPSQCVNEAPTSRETKIALTQVGVTRLRTKKARRVQSFVHLWRLA